MTDALVPAMPFGRLVRAYLSDAKYESLRLLRTPAFSVPILAMPVLFYSFFGIMLAGRAAGGQLANNLFVGWTVYGVMGPGLFGFGILVAVERNQGLLTFKRALPMPAGSYLASKLMMAFVFAVVVMAMLVTIGVTIGHVTLPAITLLRVAAVMSLGVIPACAVGLFIGAWAPASSAAAFANIVYLGMAFLSGLFFPLSGVMERIRPIWPTYHLSQLARASAGLTSEGSPLTHLAILAAMSAVLTWLAARKLARRG
ncbi:ABC transporter permease [Phenylobacterium sp.]|uniref:ABC transporter permease n=1 Tax=Phenylobacterium sp. TaxID=1871053 RepID=UPI00286C50C9|nr:ABC transporter permease [Phenylobacterium sp.]